MHRMHVRLHRLALRLLPNCSDTTEHEVTVRFKRALPKKEREQVEEKFGFTIARQNEFVPNQFVVKVPISRGVDVLKVANDLDADDDVEFATPNFVSEHRR